jgi:tripartite-type tricarboxylate transporter receptor subunit TctC
VLSRLRPEVSKALGMPDIREKLRNAGGVEPWITSPEEFSAELRREHARFAQLVKDVGAKLD